MKNKLLLYTAIGSLSLLASSCTKEFESTNNDPNNPANVPNSYLLTGAERGLMDNTCDVWWGGQVGNQLAQYWSSNQYTSESRYQFRTAVTNGWWNLFYAGGTSDTDVPVGGLRELNKIISLCTSTPDAVSTSGYPANQIACAKILRCWLLQNMTDTWGAIPASEAAGLAPTRTPVYDNQQAIYTLLLSDIKSAIAGIDENESGPVGDVIYNGDMAQWRKFGNAVLMRIALRVADKSGDFTGLAADFDAASQATFGSNADNALFPYSEGTEANPVYYNRFVDRRNDYCASNTMLDILDSLSDPRLECYYAPATSSGAWVGEVYGLSEANGASTPNSSVSQRSALILSSNLPGIYMDYAQVEFMMAEGVERGWITGDAETHYNNAVSASIEYWTGLNGTTPDIAAYLARPEVAYATAGSTWKEKIGKQKWIALYNQGVQGWTEYRRLDFGILQLPADGVLDGSGIPLRMRYPVDEQTLNSGNYSSAVASQGTDDHGTRIWWDIQ